MYLVTVEYCIVAASPLREIGLTSMPRSSTLASVVIDVAEEPREIAQPVAETPFRILVAGNFSGGAGRYRRPIEIDRDNFDDVMERVGPALSLPFGQSEVALAFLNIDDFHPDHLFEHLAPFQALRDLRARVEDGSALPRANSQAAGAPPASGADLLAQMMGEAPAGARQSPLRPWLCPCCARSGPTALGASERAGPESRRGRSGRRCPCVRVHASFRPLFSSGPSSTASGANARHRVKLSSDRYHGDQSPSGSVVCPTSIRYPSGSRM